MVQTVLVEATIVNDRERKMGKKEKDIIKTAWKKPEGDP